MPKIRNGLNFGEFDNTLDKDLDIGSTKATNFEPVDLKMKCP